MSPIHQHRLENGLWLIAEPVAAVQSLAMTLLVPAGSAAEPARQQGIAAILAEMICRGAGPLDARAHSEALDQLGVQRSTTVQSIHMGLSAAMIGSKLTDALDLLLYMVRAPQLAAQSLEASRDLALQALDALNDDPQERLLVTLRQRHLPAHLGRCHLGTRPDVEAMQLAHVQDYWKQRFVADDAILAFAGRFDWTQLKDLVEHHLGQWDQSADEPAPGKPGPGGYFNDQSESAQVHIGIAYDAVPEPDERSILQHAAQAVLSGGMSGRLFTEVREKRGLCYSVYASYAGLRDRGVMLCYAGTTAPRAQETLDVLIGELRRLGDRIDADEFERAIVGMKSRLVMQGESTMARARAIAADQYLLGRPRSLSEVAAKIDAITLDTLRSFVAEHRPGPMTIVSLGPKALRAG